MKKNIKSPELATFTLLNPDFHAVMDNESAEQQMSSESGNDENTLPDNTK